MRNKIKSRIKDLAFNQRSLKEHRKTVNFLGFRDMIDDGMGGQQPIYPDTAIYLVNNARREIRHLHVLYDLVRGKLYWNDGKIFTNDGNEFSFKKAEFNTRYLEWLSKKFEKDVEAS